MDTYAVVRFEDEKDTVELVPTKWIKDAFTVYWPPYDEEGCEKALRKEEDVQSTWRQCRIKVLCAAGRSIQKHCHMADMLHQDLKCRPMLFSLRFVVLIHWV